MFAGRRVSRRVQHQPDIDVRDHSDRIRPNQLVGQILLFLRRGRLAAVRMLEVSSLDAGSY